MRHDSTEHIIGYDLLDLDTQIGSNLLVVRQQFFPQTVHTLFVALTYRINNTLKGIGCLAHGGDDNNEVTGCLTNNREKVFHALGILDGRATELIYFHSSRKNVLLNIRHLYRSNSSLDAFVPQSAAGSVKCLLLVKCSQDREDNRAPAFGIQQSHSLRNGLTHIVEMRCIALNDATDNNDSMRFFAIHHYASSVRQFDCAGHMGERDIILIHSMLDQGLPCAIRHSIGDLAVPIGYNNCVALMFEHISARQYCGVIFAKVGSHYSAKAINLSISCASAEEG